MLAGTFGVAGDQVVVTFPQGSVVVVDSHMSVDAVALHSLEAKHEDYLDYFRKFLDREVAKTAADAVFKDLWSGDWSQISAEVDSLVFSDIPASSPTPPTPAPSMPETPQATTPSQEANELPRFTKSMRCGHSGHKSCDAL